MAYPSKYLGNDAKPHTGAFARYVVAKAALVMHIPENVSFEAASTVGVGFGTAGYALYKVLGLPLPDDEVACSDAKMKDKTFLIYGGSTATGTIAIQLAKL
jgi:NADPH:quinone reductase-like Zn-dependent oxidoreductase